MIPDPLGDAVRRVRDGGLVGYPTETVWGLAADASTDAAVERLLRWKGRETDEPVAILLEGPEAAEDAGVELGAAARRLVNAFWPGPLTLVVPCTQRYAPGVAREDGAVGVRCSSHPLATALARRLRREGVGPITATSLNRRGEAPAQSAVDARALCGEGDDEPHLVEVDGAECGGDAASTVVDLTGEHPLVLRWGALPEADLAPVLRGLDAP